MVDNNEDMKTIRGKWIFDGATNIDEMIQSLEDRKEFLEELKEEGWELKDSTVDADYAHLTPPKSNE